MNRLSDQVQDLRGILALKWMLDMPQQSPSRLFEQSKWAAGATPRPALPFSRSSGYFMRFIQGVRGWEALAVTPVPCVGTSRSLVLLAISPWRTGTKAFRRRG